MSKISQMFKMVILGAPGSGKGTISSRIVRDFGLQHLSSGDILRSQIMKKTELGLKAQTYMNKGALVPDDVIVNLIASELDDCDTKKPGWLLDGFPRTITQAVALHKLHELNCVVSLDVPHEVIIDRIKGRWVHVESGRVYNTEFNPPKVQGIDDETGEKLIQRDDDKPESVKARLVTYSTNTTPLIDFYSSLKIIKEFQGTESNKIWPHVHQHLTNFLTPIN